MALRMAGLKRRKSGAWGSRITVPEDVRAEYQALYRKHVDELFYAPADCPSRRAQVLFSEWQAEIKNRIATLRAKQRGECHDLTQRQARALAGEWYRWYVNRHEENPGQSCHWAKLREILLLLLEDVGGDPETRKIDREAPGVREEIHPRLADEAKTAQFLASKGEALTPAAMALFLDAVIDEFLHAADLLQRRAAGDYSPDQHMHTLAEYRKAAPQSAAPGSRKTAVQLFEGYISASNLAAGSVIRWRVVFTTLDKHLAGRDFDALSDDEAQRWVAALVTRKRSAFTVMSVWVTALKAVGKWAVKQREIAINPFADCSVSVPKKTRHRETKAFSTEEIRLILTSANAIKNKKARNGRTALGALDLRILGSEGR